MQLIKGKRSYGEVVAKNGLSLVIFVLLVLSLSQSYLTTEAEMLAFMMLCQILILMLVFGSVMSLLLSDLVEEHKLNSHTKSQFLASMSHEIRTPLTAIIGFSESLRDNAQLDETERKGQLSTIIKSGHHLLNVINDILDLSKIEAKKINAEKIEVDLPALILNIQSLFEPSTIDKGLDFNIIYHFPIPSHVSTDPTRLNQIIMNLLSNALKFTEQGSINLEIGYDTEKQHITVSVVDTGIGISNEQIDKVFNSFTQADDTITRKHGGTGLGLSIVKQLSEILGGGVNLSSEQGSGTTFKFWINAPAISSTNVLYNEDDVLYTIKSDIEDENIQLVGHILLAEDNKNNQLLINNILQELGCTVEIANNGAEAYEKYHNAYSNNKFYDLLLTDIQMPEMSGVDLTRALRNEGIELPIVAITANVMADEIISYHEAGCNDVIAKPIKRQLFIASLKQYLPLGPPKKPEKNRDSINTGESSKYKKWIGNILLAEDNLDNQRLIKLFLEGMGVNVTTADDGEQALEYCMSHSFNLVLLDLNMPKASGYEVQEVLSSMSYQPPVYALTADNDSDNTKRCLTAGFKAVLPKPIDKDLMIHIIAQHLEPESNAKSPAMISAVSKHDLADRFITGLPEMLDKMQHAKDQSNWPALQDCAHQIKGIAGSYGYDSLTLLAKNLELSLKNNDPNTALQQLELVDIRMNEIFDGHQLWRKSIF